MTVACYFEPVNEGCIIVEPFGSRLTNIGLVFKHFKAARWQPARGNQGRKK